MMLRIPVTFLLVICSFSVSAERIKGLIITKAQDTLDVTFEIPLLSRSKQPNYERLQRGVTYYDANGKKQTLNPAEAVEIHFTHDNEVIRMRTRFNPLVFLGGSINLQAGSSVLLRLLEDGPTQLFLYYYSQNTTGIGTSLIVEIIMACWMKPTAVHILQKGDSGELKSIQPANFKKDMTAFFSDCPELVRKIEEKEYKREDLRAMVQFYNTQCGK
ncbi:MAG: hypothetical protein ACR2K1_08510 [Saprospiraceae bacterium]